MSVSEKWPGKKFLQSTVMTMLFFKSVTCAKRTFEKSSAQSKISFHFLEKNYVKVVLRLKFVGLPTVFNSTSKKLQCCHKA